MATNTETIAGVGFAVLVLGGLMLNAALVFRVEQRMKAQAATQWVDSGAVEHTCYANRSDVTCTFTNRGAGPITTCVQGTLAPKGAGGVTLQSLTLCSGRLGPLETKSVAAPWIGGFADDLCYETNQFGSKNLDWSKCNFSTGPEDLKASLAQ